MLGNQALLSEALSSIIPVYEEIVISFLEKVLGEHF